MATSMTATPVANSIVDTILWFTDMGFKRVIQKEDNVGEEVLFEDENDNYILHRPETPEYTITRFNGDVAFEGRIPNKEFARQLIENLDL